MIDFRLIQNVGLALEAAQAAWEAVWSLEATELAIRELYFSGPIHGDSTDAAEGEPISPLVNGSGDAIRIAIDAAHNATALAMVASGAALSAAYADAEKKVEPAGLRDLNMRLLSIHLGSKGDRAE